MKNELTHFYCTAFLGVRAVTSGSLEHVISTVKDSLDDSHLTQLLIFDDSTGNPVDVDFRGTTNDVLKRLRERFGELPDTDVNQKPTPRVGRPKLGVVSGEVTLLPRHWEWLKSQPGGASVTLRKLVDEARRVGEKQSQVRESQEATYRVMTAMAGNFPQYEEALRAMYASDSERFYHFISTWEPDVRDYIRRLVSKSFPDMDMDR